MKKKLFIALAALVLLGGLIQLVPYGRNHTNPPVIAEPAWSSPEARAMVKQHCFMCHSNEVEWPWYSNVAPASWLIYRDVEEGRRKLNFSEWGRRGNEVDEIIEVVQEGEMPPFQYWLFHPSSRLNDQQKSDLIQALRSSLR